MTLHTTARIAAGWAIRFGLVLTSVPGAAADSATPAPSATPVAAAVAPTVNAPSSTGIINAADYPDLQAAVDAVPYPGGTVFLPAATYSLTKPLDLTNRYNNGPRTRWLVLQGAGIFNSIIMGDFPDAPVVDMTGSGRVVMRDLTITGKSKCLLLSARRNNAGGGGNAFYNCMFRGAFAQVAVWLVGSECNRFYNCEMFTDQPNAVTVAFTPAPEFEVNGVTYSIKSPYEPNMTGGSTTELRFYGSFIHSFGRNSIGLYCQGSTADISIDGGYNANGGFASIYLDGTKANVGDSAFRNLRIEGETGLYCLYAKGAVRNVTIDSGDWGSAGEVIRYERATTGHGANSGAEGWCIRNASLTIQDQSVRGPERTGALCKLPRDQRAILRFDRMENCRIDNIWVRAYQIIRVPKAAAGAAKPEANKDHGTVIQNAEFQTEDKLEYYTPKLLVCTEWARGCTVQAGAAADVVLPADSAGNRIECLSDGGVRRTYLSGGSRPDILNFAPVDPSTVKVPKRGDVILAPDGAAADAPLRLVVFDGKAWQPLAGPVAGK